MVNTIKVLMIPILLCSCGLVEPADSQPQKDLQTIHLDYRGMVAVEGGRGASFALVNDSTTAIQYFGYSESNPLYSGEALSDTGWTSLWWGWCGTGAVYHVLAPGSQVNFVSMLPTSNGVWRLLLDISDVGDENYRRLRSKEIVFNAP
jgi:hypothetical protein